MKEVIFLLATIGVMFALIIINGGILVWLSTTTDGILTPAQDALLKAADTMIKFCFGAVLGLSVALLIAARKSTSAKEITLDVPPSPST